MKRRLILLPVLLCACASVQAHSPDTSFLRCRVEPRQVELRFTFGLAALYRIVQPDTDGDGKLTRAEMEAVAVGIYDYLEATIRFEINGQPVPLGERQALGWPVDAGESVAEKDYQGLLLNFTFLCRSPSLIEDIYVSCELFGELGDSHRIIEDIEQEGKHQEVVYTLLEPDYLYDTFWRRTGSFKEGISVVWSSGWIVGGLFVVALFAFRADPRWGALAVLGAVIVGVGVETWATGGGMQRSFGLFAGSILAIVVWLPAVLMVGKRPFPWATPDHQLTSRTPGMFSK